MFKLAGFLISLWLRKISDQHIGNKAKRPITKRVFQENKGRQFSKKRTFLTPWYAHIRCVSGGKRCSFFGKFGVLCFLETSVLCVSGGKKCSFFGKFGVFCFLQTPIWRFDLFPFTDEHNSQITRVGRMKFVMNSYMFFSLPILYLKKKKRQTRNKLVYKFCLKHFWSSSRLVS